MTGQDCQTPAVGNRPEPDAPVGGPRRRQSPIQTEGRGRYSALMAGQSSDQSEAGEFRAFKLHCQVAQFEETKLRRREHDHVHATVAMIRLLQMIDVGPRDAVGRQIRRGDIGEACGFAAAII